jgi:phosphoglycolate phosphatase
MMAAMRIPSPRAAVIDLDGTLIDTIGDFVVALNAMLDELGHARVDRAFVERTVGQGSAHLIRGTLAQVGAPAAAYDAAWASYQRHYLGVNGAHAQVFPGVVEGLVRLRERGIRLACLTNKPTAFALPLLHRKGLDGYFAFTFGGDAFARGKPDPLPLLETCKALASAPSDTLVVGDSRNDAIAARAAGCPVWLVTYGYNQGEPIRGVDADGFIDRLDELPISC